MADIRVKDLNESAAPGADYWLLTDSATDGPKKVKTSNIVTKTDIGLGDVDNTSDLDKPVSTATQSALDDKANTADLGSAAYLSSSAFATGAQGALADTALQPSDTGTLPGKIVKLDSSGRLPAVNGSQLLNLPGGGDALKANLFVSTRSVLAGLTGAAAPVVSVYADGGTNGTFFFDSSDLSAQVTADTLAGVYIPPTSDPTGASGAWVRERGALAQYSPRWFGAVADGATDDRAAVAAADAFGPVLIDAEYAIASNLTISSPIVREPGGALVAGSGATITLTGALDAARGGRMFKGAGTFALDYRNTEVDLSLFADSATDYSAAAQRALDAGAVSLVVSEEGVTFSGPSVVIPNGERITISFHVQLAYFAALGSATPHFSYSRPPVSGGTLLTIRGQNYTLLMESGGGKTSNFLNFNGHAQTSGMSITRSGTTATCTLPSHGYSSGQTAYIAGADQSAYNGAFVVTVVNANTFTYTVSGSPATPATGTLWAYGRESGVPWSDNAFVLQDIEFRGFYNVVSSTYASGNKIEKIIGRDNNITVSMGRGTAFTEFVDWLDVGSGAALRLVDPVPNGLTNGIRLEKVYGVLNNGGVPAITISGVESVIGDGNSVDICSAGSYCVEISNCTSVDLGFTWMASDLGAASTHRGMLINDVYRSDIRILNIVNQYVGVEVVATTDTSSPRYCHLGLGTFKGVTAAGILGNAAKGVSVGDGVRFADTMPRTGSNYEMYFTGGTDYWSLGRVIMNQPSYTLPSSGANSQAPSVMFV